MMIPLSKVSLLFEQSTLKAGSLAIPLSICAVMAPAAIGR
jgi:hypothetical protein